MSEKGKAIKKRQQIDRANRKMFLAVAVASFLTGFALVASVFIINKMVFNTRVISEKNKTYNALLNNNSNIIKLADQVRALEVNEALLSVRLNDEEQAFRVVLDALPAVGNSTALGASLREKILSVPGVLIESIVVNPTAEESSGATPESDESNSAATSIEFTFKVIGAVSDLSQVLKNLERSIRPVVVDTIRFEVSTVDAQSSLMVTGHSFYEPMAEAKLGSKKLESGK